MLSRRLKDIELLADFQPDVPHTPVEFVKSDIMNLLSTTPEARTVNQTNNDIPGTDNLDGHISPEQLRIPMLEEAVEAPRVSHTTAQFQNNHQSSEFNPYREYNDADFALDAPRDVSAISADENPQFAEENGASQDENEKARIAALAEKITLQKPRINHIATSEPVKSVPQPVEYFEYEPAESEAYEIPKVAKEQLSPKSEQTEDSIVQKSAPQFEPDDPRYRLLSQYTTSEQLKLLKMLKSDDSEVCTRLDGEGNVYVRISILRAAHTDCRMPTFLGKYEETHYFGIPARDVPFDGQIQNKTSENVNTWRAQRGAAKAREQARIQQQLARPYMATPRTVSWLHAQLFDIFKQISAHYVAESNRFDDLLKVVKFTQKMEQLQPLTPFSDFVMQIYAYAKIGHIEKAQTYLEELRDASYKYYEVSAAARILTILMQYEREYPQRTTEFPHRQQDFTAEEVNETLEQEDIILPIVVYCVSKLFKQTKVFRVLTNTDSLEVARAESSSFSRIDLRLPRHFDARTLEFPISRPVLANALVQAFQAYEIPFSAQLVVVEIERLPIWLESRGSFTIELFLLLENLIRVLLACLNGFNGFFGETSRPAVTKASRLGVEELLGI